MNVITIYFSHCSSNIQNMQTIIFSDLPFKKINI